MIEVRDLSVGWGGKAILSGMTFHVDARERFAILGGSGCGKSTLLRHLIGLEVPMAGSVRIAGSTPTLSDEEPPRAGVLFQSSALFGSETLLENVALPLRRWTSLSRAAMEEVAYARLRLVGLGGFENHLPAEVSGGMRKRAGIARALALEPGLLFLDEPSAGLDPITSAELDRLMLTLNQDLGVTIVFVSHEMESILTVATRCIVLDREAGGIIADASPTALRDESSDPRIRAFFHRLPRSA
jgi:phospholipid/cholesterol/gamma-HCH transport system ATP-binding protein